MKVYNHTFINYKTLTSFLDENGIQASQNLLIQCFDGFINQSNIETLLFYLVEKLPHAKIIGSSTDGEIMNGRAQSASIVLSFSVFESTQMHSGVVSLEEGSFDAGVKLGELALEFGAKAMILFSGALKANGDFLMQGISSVGSGVLVSGGMAGDNGEFQQTYVMHKNKVYQNSAVAVFLKGESLSIYNTNSFNWLAIGPSFRVTSSHENKVYTLNNKPIVEIYREYLGEDVANTLPAVGVAFPIIMHVNGEQVGRAPIFLCENGGLGFGGNIPESAVVQFGIGNLNLILEASDTTVQNVLEAAPEAIFVYSCMARRRYMGESVDYETLPLNQIAPVSGFFTYGEFFTHANTKNCSLLNETMTILALSENRTKSSLRALKHVGKKTNDWSKISFKALSHIINKTSIELQTLNESLQIKVQEEIALNREKDKMMLAQSKRATMGEMVNMIAHQWRQPITTIGLISDNLALDVALEELTFEKTLNATQMINAQVQYLSKTIEDFGNYFRPNSSLEAFEVGELYKDLTEIVGKNLENHGILMLGEFAPTAKIHTCKRELFQICINLFNNSKDAILQNNIPDGYIKFAHRKVKGMDEISIRDNGGGIDSALFEKIFEPYFSTKHSKNGTGLGLYMSKTIAQQQLKGDLIHYNDEKGAVFVLTFEETTRNT